MWIIHLLKDMEENVDLNFLKYIFTKTSCITIIIVVVTIIITVIMMVR